MIVNPFFLFAPGAGAPSSHPWMQRWKESLTQIGDVETLNYGYMREGRKRPGRLPQLIAAHRAALAAARTKTSGPIILIGKSMVAELAVMSRWKKKWMALFAWVIRFARWVIARSCAIKCCAICTLQFFSCKARAIRFARSIYSKAFAKK